MKNIFTPKTTPPKKTHDIIVRHHNTATYGDKSLTAERHIKYGINFLQI